jgi:hypothetical protein
LEVDACRPAFIAVVGHHLLDLDIAADPDQLPLTGPRDASPPAVEAE